MVDIKFRSMQLEYVAKNIDIQESIPNSFSQDKITKSDFDELMENITVSNLNKEDEELFFQILEDKYITTEEAQSLHIVR